MLGRDGKSANAGATKIVPLTKPDPARTYHAETSYLSVTGDDFIHGPRPHCLTDFQAMDPGNVPAPFKQYPGVARVALPRDFADTNRPALEVLAGVVAPAPKRFDVESLARLVFFTAGVTRVAKAKDGSDRHFRVASAAGNLHPVEVYLATADAPGLGAGLYHFDPRGFALEMLRPGDWRGELADAAGDAVARTAYLVLTGIPFRTGWKYSERGYRHIYWDAGSMLAGSLAEVEAAGWRASVMLGFDDASVTRLLGLDGLREFPLTVIALDAGGAQPPLRAPAAFADLELDESALAKHVVEFPLVTATQRAGDLSGSAAVTQWREAAVGQGRPAGESTVTAKASGPEQSIESLILQRGSTRMFRRGETPHRFLVWAMAAAGRPVDADFVAPGRTLLEHDLAVHEVAGVGAGYYRWRFDALEVVAPMAEAAIRQESYAYCAAQPLGGDSAYTTYHCADLEAVLSALGPRGYRAAQLEAGLVSGRLNLAAFALGLGASALTFVDVAVRARFGGDCMLVTSMGIPDYANTKGGRPGRETVLKGFGPLMERVMERFEMQERSAAERAP